MWHTLCYSKNHANPSGKQEACQVHAIWPKQEACQLGPIRDCEYYHLFHLTHRLGAKTGVGLFRDP